MASLLENNNKMTTIDKTEHYVLEVGNNPYDSNHLQYLIRNIETKVIEADSRLLPMARKYLSELEAYYHAQEDFENDMTMDDLGDDIDDNSGYTKVFDFRKKH